MKLVYMGPNSYEITKFVTNLCYNDYEFSGAPSVKYSRHNTAIFKIAKDDTDVVRDMFYILSSRMIYRRLVETMYHYYLSMDVYNLLELTLANRDNYFIREIEKVCKRYYPFSNKNRDRSRIDYPIPYNHTHDLHILTDTRYLVSDYMNILVHDFDISRLELNELFTVSFMVKAPLIDERILRREKFIIDSPYHCNLYKGHLTFKETDYDRDVLIKVSRAFPESILDTESIYLSKKRILGFVGEYSGRTGIDCRDILPNNTLTDIVLTMSINDLIQNYDGSSYIEDALNFLLENVPNMDFIITGKERP